MNIQKGNEIKKKD